MTKLTLAALLALAVIFTLAEMERRADLEKMQVFPIPPVQPALVWLPPRKNPEQHVCPPGADIQQPVVTVPMALEEMP